MLLNAIWLVFTSLVFSVAADSTTPCFIPLPELALTTSLDANAPSVSSAAHNSGGGGSSDLNVSKEEIERTNVTTTSRFSGKGESRVDNSTSQEIAQPSTTSSEVNTGANDNCSPILSSPSTPLGTVTHAFESPTSTTTVTVSITLTPTSHPTRSQVPNEGICTPYCAALDSEQRCVSIQGCGYTASDRRNLRGRAETAKRGGGCCPLGYYSGAELLVALGTGMLGVLWWVRG